MTKKENQPKTKHTLRNVLLLVGIANLIPAGIIFAGVTNSDKDESPAVLSVSKASGAPGSLVEVDLALSNNTKGWISAGFVFDYDADLELQLEDPEEAQYSAGIASQGLSCQQAVDTEQGLLSLAYAGSSVNRRDGVIGTLYFQIPEDAQPGEEFDIALKPDLFCTRPTGEKQCKPVAYVVESGSITVSEISDDEVSFDQLGGRHQISVKTDLPIRWTSSDPRIADVDDEGNVTAGIPGEATISAEFGDKKVDCKVKVGGDFEKMRGNVDNNAAINSDDAVLVLKNAAKMMISGKCDLTPAQQAIADVNNDGQMNASDAGSILVFSAKRMMNPNATWAEFVK